MSMKKVIHLVSHFGCFDDHDCKVACGTLAEEFESDSYARNVTCKNCLRVFAASESRAAKAMARSMAAREAWADECAS
jgi:hypothetical protein